MNKTRACILLIVCGTSVALGQESPTVATVDEASALRGALLAPKVFRAAAQRVSPAVVRIEGFGGLAVGVSAAGIDAPGEGPTTGVILSSDGLIATSTFNFLRKPPVITVVLASGERKVARMLGRDETRKICLLKVDGVMGLPVPEFAPRESLRVGQWVVALGVGYGGREQALSAGILSALHRIGDKAVQTDANLSPANYGGPLIDLDGRVVGLCVPLSPQAQSAGGGSEWYDSGIGFAVPLAGGERWIDRLKMGETLQPPFLGVQAKPYGDPPTGAEAAEVVAGGPAAKAGLKKGDRLLELGGAEVLDVTQLVSLIQRYAAGDKVDVVLRRGDKEERITVELGVAPPPQKPQPAQPPAKAGPNPPKPQPPRPEPE